MKTYIKTSVAIFIATLMILCINSCKKKGDPKEPVDTDTQTAQDNFHAENLSNDILNIGGQAIENATLTTYKLPSVSDAQLLPTAPGATITGLGTLTITIDFGTGVLCKDGRTRKGKLIFDLSASTPTTNTKYRNPGFRCKVSAQNYVVDNYSVNIINKVIANTTPTSIPTGTNPGTNLTWSVTANLQILKPNNGGTITWMCNRTKELINTNDPTCYQGQNMPIIWSKAKVKHNGTANGVNAKGENYTLVAKDLIRDFTCSPYPSAPNRHPFISGIIEYTPGNKPTRYINYGNGTCDAEASITVNGITVSFTIP
ncbi:MAG: hypothetical protein N3F09_06060 [Bacteroidia bacterium]|nr:hypothetical protein [Bacteroidia bacterium]